MKKVFTIAALIACIGSTLTAFAQQGQPTEITRRNSWLKIGAGIGVPVGSLSNISEASLNLDLKGQVLSTPNTGFGIATGYMHYFPKDGQQNFGSVPVGLFGRYYFQREGLFLGSDVGYSIQTGTGSNGKGGIYVKPQIGYHNPSWNVFGFYNGIFRGENQGSHLQQVGVGFSYNLMFR